MEVAKLIELVLPIVGPWIYLTRSELPVILFGGAVSIEKRDDAFVFVFRRDC